MQTRFVIYGTQRTGTTLLVGLLDNHPDILSLGELFQPRGGRGHGPVPRYRPYLRGMVLPRLLDLAVNWLPIWRSPLARLCDPPLRRSVTEYLDTVYAADDCRAVGFKLMLNQARRYPQVLDYCQQRQVKVIQVVRDNLLKTHVSRLRARQTGIYASARPVETAPIQVPLGSLLADLEALAGERAALEDSVSALDLAHLTVRYEELTGENRRQHLPRILAFLGVPETVDLEPRLVKLTADDLEQAVENYEALADLLRQTAYEIYL